MAFRLRVPVPGGARSGARVRLAAAAVVATVVLLAGGSGAAAVGGGQTGIAPLAVLQDGTADGAVLRLTRFDPASRREAVAGAHGKQDERADSYVVRGLEWGRALFGRYGAERVLLAVVVGALVQVLCLLVLRLVGSVVRLVARVLAGALGVVVALSLLDGAGWRPAWADEALRWLGRLVDLVGLVA
jgi:hypothetical protein